MSHQVERPAAEQDFERFEGGVHQLFAAAERAALARELERLDVDRAEVSIGGRRHRRVRRASETYTSAAGPVTVQRTLYRAGSEQAVVPVELPAGIIGGHWTPLAARQASYVVGPCDAAGGCRGERPQNLRPSPDPPRCLPNGAPVATRVVSLTPARPGDTLLLDGRPAGCGAAAEAVRSAPCRCGACESPLSYDAPRRQWWCSGCSTGLGPGSAG